ncbi:Hypothetical predicted protein [Pelobates cultripes]|uniref:UPAR/Ly6 domain-containing protein n=1 Tax=Pelobates cultripes TaxID=61616 RepID=A0AAD1WYL0_PELCU|nr:Hypothetical predicted protein [Pelobates cultripes]
MHTLLILACLLTFLLEVSSLTCYQCESSSGLPCTGYLATCVSSAKRCISIYEETFASGGRSNRFARGCGITSQCDVSGTVSLLDRTYRTSSTCCKDSMCTPPFPVLPPYNNSYLNGRTCPSCVSYMETDCNSGLYKNCTGLETYCLYESMKTTGGQNTIKTALRGCATKSMCDLGDRTTKYNGITTTIKVSCRSGSAETLYSSLFLLGIVIIRLI